MGRLNRSPVEHDNRHALDEAACASVRPDPVGARFESPVARGPREADSIETGARRGLPDCDSPEPRPTVEPAPDETEGTAGPTTFAAGV